MQSFIRIMAPHLSSDALPLLQDLYRAFLEDPAAATLEARLRFREFTPDMVATVRGWLLEFQAYQATLQQQQAMQKAYREEQERKRRSEEESRRSAAELGGVYGSALASMGFSPTLSVPSSSYTPLPSYGGGLPSGGVSSAELDEQALLRGMFAEMLVSVIDGHGDPMPNVDSRLQDSALNYLRGRLSFREWVERVVGPDLCAQFEQGQQLLASFPEMRWYIRWMQESLRIQAAWVVPRSHLNELLFHLRGGATPVSAPDTERVPGQPASTGQRPERGGLPAMRDLKAITRWLDQHRRALQEGQLTPLDVLNQGFLTGGHLTEEQFKDAVAGRIHLAQKVGLGDASAIVMIKIHLMPWQRQGDHQAAKTVFEALTAIDQHGLCWRFLGNFYSGQEDWSSALASFERALEINPRNLLTQQDRAEALFYLGRFAEAEGELRRIAQLNSTLEEQKVANRARSFLEEKQQAFQKVLALLNQYTAPTPPKEPRPGVRFDVVLTNSGTNKITVIRQIRELTGFGLGLKEAKDLVEHPPSVVLKGIEQAHAERARDLLKAVGATVRLEMARTSETKDGGAFESSGWVH